jgi:ABC-type branched-subunit amino acid transport system ATPase component
LEKEVPGDPVLRASGLRKTFGGVVAVDSLSLELACGETTALIGPNGSGKTTALRLISGAAAPDAGAVSFAGRDVTAASTAERVRLGIARTLQTTIAFTELTALENVLVGRSVRGRHGGLIRTALATPRARSEAAASEAAALEALALVGLDWAADVPAPQLTSSERRLLALAAALATGPDVLLVDELAAGAGTDELDRLAAGPGGSPCSSSSTTCASSAEWRTGSSSWRRAAQSPRARSPRSPPAASCRRPTSAGSASS